MGLTRALNKWSRTARRGLRAASRVQSSAYQLYIVELWVYVEFNMRQDSRRVQHVRVPYHQYVERW